MVTEAPPTLVTAEELLRLSAKGFYGELIRGELCEAMPPGIRHGKIVARIAALLLFFVDPKKLGTVVAGDPGVWLEQATPFEGLMSRFSQSRTCRLTPTSPAIRKSCLTSL